MNIEAQELLSKMIAKDVRELTPTDIAFLRARRSYLSEEDSKRLQEVLGIETSDEMEELREQAKALGVKSVHLYKTPEKLREKIANYNNYQTFIYKTV